MSGFAAIVDWTGAAESLQRAEPVARWLAPRGPDGVGVMMAERDPDGEAALFSTLRGLLRPVVVRASPEPALPVAAIPDPGALALLARGHGVASLLSRALERASLPGGAETAALLASDRRRAVRRGLLAGAELRSLTRGLRDAGVRAVAFKGPVLAEALYSSCDARIYRDLDLLVARDDVARAAEYLSEHGYEAVRALSPARRARLLRVGYHLGMLRARDHMLVEIHWRIADPYLPAPGVEGIIERAVTVPVQGEPVPGPSAEDHLLCLCVHGAKHHWDRLAMVADVAALIDRTPSLDWDRLTDTARRCGALRRLCTGVSLAARLFRFVLPVPVRGQDPVASRLAGRFNQDLAQRRRDALGLFQHAGIDLSGLERLRDRFRYCLGVLAPGDSDWAGEAGPDWLLPLVRPWRLVRRYGLSRRAPAPGRHKE